MADAATSDMALVDVQRSGQAEALDGGRKLDNVPAVQRRGEDGPQQAMRRVEESATETQPDTWGKVRSSEAHTAFRRPAENLWRSSSGNRARPRGRALAASTTSRSWKYSIRLPSRSPVRASKWYRRPPSPLAWHVRPLWTEGSGPRRKSSSESGASEGRSSDDGDQSRKLALSQVNVKAAARGGGLD